MNVKADIKNTAEGPVLGHVTLEMKPTDLLVLISALRMFDEDPDKHIVDRYFANRMVDEILNALSGSAEEDEHERSDG